MSNVNEFSFGVEIECFVPHAAMQGESWSVGGYHSGRAIPSFAGWRADADGSISPKPGFTAVEVVSPILRGSDGLAEVRRMCGMLAVMGAEVNRSCGFHVHVGWAGAAATVPALRRLICLVAQHEKGLFAATGTKSRELSSYTPSIRQRLRAVEDLSTMEQLAQAQPPRGTLNLLNLLGGSKRTVEFRVFAGTVSAPKMTAYVALSLGLVQRAQDTKVAVAWDSKGKALRLRKGEGLNALTRLFGALGWTSHLGVKTRYGLIDSEVAPLAAAPVRARYGMVDGSDTHVLRHRKELQRLAKKYDAVAPAAAVNSW